jgi:hypothetical protein
VTVQILYNHAKHIAYNRRFLFYVFFVLRWAWASGLFSKFSFFPIFFSPYPLSVDTTFERQHLSAPEHVTTKALPLSLQNAQFPFPDGKSSTSLPLLLPFVFFIT